MTPKTPSSPDGSDTPPRSRPSLGITAKDAAEQDLWAFDGEAELGEMPVPKSPKLGIPSPRYPADSPALGLASASPQKISPLPSKTPEATSDNHESIRLNVNPRLRPAVTPTAQREPQPPVVRTHPGENFDDLDQWGEPEVAAPAVIAPATMPPSAFKEMLRTESRPTPQETPAAEPSTAIRPPAEADDTRDEFSPRSHAAAGQSAVALRPALNLTHIERAGLALLVLLLIAMGGVFYFSTIRQIPAGSGRMDAKDFPIQGDKVEVVSATSYWRKPVTSGPNADTVQRETLLIPEAQFTSRGGPATLRIYFRNEHGDLVGDALTRTVQGEEKLTLTATAGFDDLGKHAAYRTSESGRWTIEVLEASPGNPAAADFKRLFVMNIGTDLR